MKEWIASVLLLLTSAAFATDDVETIQLHGADYLVSKVLPEEILGTYNYESKSEPIIQLNPDNTGLFQPHGMPAIPFKYWIHMDPDGKPHREVGNEQRYRYTLLVQYFDSSNGNYPSGKYDLFDVTMLKDRGIAVMLGERIRQLN